MSVFLQFEGQRNKLSACDGNEIDTMFVDRRRVGGQNGQTLVNGCAPLLLIVGCFHFTSDVGASFYQPFTPPQVICCEGNAGFYEVGCMNTPLEGEQSCGSWPSPVVGGAPF